MAIGTEISRPFRVLIAGGSYGGLTTAIHLLDHCSGAKAKAAAASIAASENESTQPTQSVPNPVRVDVTIVDERDGFYHLIGTPLAFSSEEFAPRAWVKYQDIPALQGPNVQYIQGTVSSIDAAVKEATVIDIDTKMPRKLAYDFFVAATGLRREWPSAPRSLRRKNYVFEAESQIAAMAATAGHGGTVIVGGGAVGVEYAAELKLYMPKLPVTLVHSRDRLMSAEPLPDDFKDRTLELVQEAGVDVRLNTRLRASRPLAPRKSAPGILPVSNGVELEFEDGTRMLAGSVVMAVSKAHPSTSYLPSGALDNEKYAYVTASLSIEPSTGVPHAEDHFVVGDAARWSGIKRCGTAMYMGMFAANNVFRRMLQAIEDKTKSNAPGHGHGHTMPKVLELAEIPPMMGVAVGKKGISYWPGQGTDAGEHVMEQMFGDDLGFKICWNHMMLGKSH